MKDKKGNIPIHFVWFERIRECSASQGTSNFVDSVWRLYWILIDLGEDNLAIQSKVEEYIKNEWKPEFKNQYDKELSNQQSDTDAIKRFIYSSVEQDRIPYLFRFIVQTIQNAKLGWTLPKGDREHYELLGYMGEDAE